MQEDLILDACIQQALVDLGFYIVFWNMTNVKRNCRWIFVLSYVPSVLLDYVVYEQIKAENLSMSLLLRAISMMFFLILYFLLCEDSPWKVCFALAVSDLFGIPHVMTASVAEGSMDRLQVHVFTELPYIPYGILIGEIGWLILFLILRKYLVRFAEEPLEKKLWVRAFASVYIANAVLHIVSVIKPETLVRGQNWISGAGLAVVLFAAVGVMLYRETKQKELQEQYHLRQQNQILKEHYEVLKEQIEITKRFRQDISSMLAEKENGGGYIRSDKAEGGTGREIIEQVVTNKIHKCQEQAVRIQTEISEFFIGEIEEMDVVLILYNILDNAIESCMKLADERERNIRLSMKNEENGLAVCCENARQGGAVLSRGRKTWKKDKELHGTGMEIVRDVVKKYRGQWEYEEKEKEFRVRILLPASGQKKEGYDGRAYGVD